MCSHNNAIQAAANASAGIRGGEGGAGNVRNLRSGGQRGQNVGSSCSGGNVESGGSVGVKFHTRHEKFKHYLFRIRLPTTYQNCVCC